MCYFLLERHAVSSRLAGDSDEKASKEGFLGARKLMAPSGDASRRRSSLVVRQVFDSPFPTRSSLIPIGYFFQCNFSRRALLWVELMAPTS
jgi:hypothetical protein